MNFQKIVQTFLLLLFANIALAQSEYAFHYYGENSTTEIAKAILVLPQNTGFVMAGSQSTNGFVVKTDSKGVAIWQKNIPSANIFAISQGNSANFCYVAGIKGNKAFISKIDLSNGTESPIWTDTIQSRINAVVKNSTNECFFTGYQVTTVDKEIFPFVVKIDAVGVLSMTSFPLFGYQPFGITTTKNQDIWLSGKVGSNETNSDSTFVMKFAANPIIKTTKESNTPNALSIAANSNHLFTATFIETSKTGALSQLDNNGTTLKTVALDGAPAAVIASDTSVIVVGNVGKSIFFRIYDTSLNLKKSEELNIAPKAFAFGLTFSDKSFTIAGSIAFSTENKADQNLLLLQILKPKTKYSIKGKLLTDNNCNATSAKPMPFWSVRASVKGIFHYAYTDKNGEYTLNSDEPGTVKLEMTPVYGWETCAAITTTIDSNGVVTTAPNIIAKDIIQTPLEVQIGTPFLINNKNATYYVKIKNNSPKAISNASLKVFFSPELKKVSESIPSTVKNDTLEFNWAKIDSFATIDFQIVRKLETTSTDSNKTYCAFAQTYPYNFAKFARYKITGKCKASTNQIEFEVKNTGTDTLSTPPSWIIIEEDLIMINSKTQKQTLKNLKGGEAQILTFNKLNKKDTAATYAMVVYQGENNVFGAYSTARIENCGTLAANYLPITTFSDQDEDLSSATSCQQAVLTVPNIPKVEAFPKGELIGKNTALPEIYDSVTLKYVFYTPNTGTKTTSSVTMITTLSEKLSLSQFNFGVCNYKKESSIKIINNNRIEAQFDNLKLVPYSVNSDSSFLYYTYSIRVPSKNNDSLIFSNQTSFRFNYAGDFTVLDSVSRLIKKPKKQTTSLQLIPLNLAKISIFPNPSAQYSTTFVTVPDSFIGDNFYLYDQQGRLLLMIPILENTFHIDADDLPNGIFFCNIKDAKQRLVAVGKLEHGL